MHWYLRPWEWDLWYKLDWELGFGQKLGWEMGFGTPHQDPLKTAVEQIEGKRLLV